MAFVREQKRGKRKYFYLVETVREPPEFLPRQKVIRYIGTKRPKGRQKGLRGLKGRRVGYGARRGN